MDEKERERERERPRILSKSNERRNSLKDNEHRDDTATKENDQGRDSAPERHGSASPATHEAPTKPHVTFADEGRENSQSPLDDQSTQVTAPMRQHKKIIMRKMGERESESPSEKQDQGGSRGQRERPKDLKTGEPGAERDSPDSRTPDRDLKVRQAWNVNDRGPIMSPMTLYEPEGKKSEAKFLKYQHQSGKVGREKHRTNSTGSKGDQEERELCSPTESKSPGEEPPEQEEQPRNEEEIADKRAQTTSPSSEKERRSGDRRGEHRKGPSERPRRQDSGRFHERHESRDAKDRPKHRREDPVRERPRRHDSSSTAGEHYEVGERGRPELSGRGSDWQEPARERGGYKSHESGRQQADRERDRDRDKERGGYSKQEPSARGYERRDGERGDRRRRDYPDTRPPPHRREQDQGERTGRQERRQPKPETVRHREEKHPREKQERVRSEEQWEPQAEHTPSPIEKTPTVEGGKDVAFSSERPRPIQHGESSSEQGSGEMKTLGETNDPKEQRMERRRPRDGRRDDGRRSERPSDRPRGQRGGQGERERDRGGKYLPRDRERGERERDERDRGDGERGERGRGDREKERGPRPHGGRQSSRDSFRSEQHEREGDERRQGRDARRTDYPERRDRGEQLGGRTRERPTPQGRRPPRSSERAEAVSEKPSAVETGRKQPEWRKEKGGKPSLTGYSGLEDISGSDWEQEIEEDSRKKQEESDLGQAAESKREQKPERRHPPRSEKPHRGDDKRHSREERRDQPQEPPPRRGRGRGRSEEARRERRGPDSARPSSYSSQRRQTGTGTGESSSKTDSKHSDTQRESREHSAMASLSHDSLDSIKLEKKAESHKSDFERYDLNSHKVAIVDDIGGQNVDEESLSPFAQSEFVEVTSKKAQKEKLKREKEEQRKLDEEKRRQKEEQLKRAKKTAGARSQGSYDRAGHLHPSHKPLTAWGSTNEGSSIWGSPSASDVSSRPEDWQSSLLPSSSAAPGSHLKVSESLWSNPSSPNVGVIGDSLQTKLNVGATGTSTFLAPSASSGDAAYSLFGHNPLSSPLLTTPPLVPHAGTTGTSGSMLDAAVDSTVPKVSQDALGSGVSSENPLASDVTQTTESHPTLPATSESETKDREEKEEGREFQKIEPRSRGRGKNLPPRFQSSKSQQQPSGPGRGRGIVRGAERKVGSGGKSEKVNHG